MPLPLLREELRIQEAGQEWDGSPCWLIHDPAANRFHRIGWLEFEFLARWETNDVNELLNQVRTETALRPSEEDFSRFLFFLEQNFLIRSSSPQGSLRLSSRAKSKKQSVDQWLVHNYLFFRIPLLKPDALLARIMPLAAPLLTIQATVLFFIISLAGLFLAARQWDVFTASFANTLTPTGFLGYFIAMAIAKCCHELGHALLAKKAGLRVPRIGIAFLVMFPVLYTDLGEGWLLNDHRKRLLISAGGMLAEAFLAAVSLLMWGILGDGALRDSFYVMAVVSLIRSLLINVSPFMRFDGYYLISDYLNIPNLQQRAFDYTRFLIRRLVLGSCETAPECLPPRLALFFSLYSVTTWIYRLVVFLGIAFAVYHYFFKTLGIILMVVEVVYFIVFPVVRELLSWRKLMPQLSSVRLATISASLLLLISLLLVPWRGEVTLPAILVARVKQPIFAPFAARVTAVPTVGQEVKSGQRLFLLDADEARFQSRLAQMQAAELRDRLRRLPVDAKGREQAAVWREEALEREQAARSQLAELKRLELKAEFDGVLADFDDGVLPGSYVTPNTLLGIVIDYDSTEIEAFAEETAFTRIKTGSTVRFYSNSTGFKGLRGRVHSIDSTRLNVLPTPSLADRHGGVIATQPSSGERLVPRDSLYRIRIKLDGQVRFSRLEPGTVAVEVEPESLAGRLIRRVASVFVRESGF